MDMLVESADFVRTLDVCPATGAALEDEELDEDDAFAFAFALGFHFSTGPGGSGAKSGSFSILGG